MDSWASLCTQAGVERQIFEKIRSSELGDRIRKGLNQVVEDETVSQTDVKLKAHDILKTSGVEVQVKNVVYHELMRLMQQGSRPPLHHIPLVREPLVFVKEARDVWETRVMASLNHLSATLGQPLLCKRAEIEQEVLRNNWNSIGTLFPTEDSIQPLFTPSDLLRSLSQVENHNFTSDPTLDVSLICTLIKVHLNGTSLYGLRERFMKLHPSNFHIDIHGGRGAQNAKDEYIEKAAKVLRRGLAPLAHQLCRSGCPVSHRRQLWCLAMGVDLTDTQHYLHFERLKTSIFEHSLLLDKLVVKDVKQVATNNDNYFVFEDTLYQVLLALMRDCTIAGQLKDHAPSAIVGQQKDHAPFAIAGQHKDHAPSTIAGQHKDHTPSANVGQLKDHAPSVTNNTEHSSSQGVCPSCGSSHQWVYPPSGIIPFQGFSLYMAPLGYLCDQAEHMYALFGELYKRFFVHLHTISSLPEGILGLCCVFESLLQAKLPVLCHHLKRIGIEPLRFAFPWMVTAFAGHLSSEEVLLLWDRIVGFNSLQILPVFAVSIFQFRASNLLQAISRVDVEAILEDLRCLKIYHIKYINKDVVIKV